MPENTFGEREASSGKVRIRYCPAGRRYANRRYAKAPVEVDGTIEDLASLLLRDDVAMLWADEGQGMVRLK